jgi:TolB protein
MLPLVAAGVEWEVITTPSELRRGVLTTTPDGELHWLVAGITLHSYDAAARRWELVSDSMPHGDVIARHRGDLFLGGSHGESSALAFRLPGGSQTWEPAENGIVAHGASRSAGRVRAFGKLDGVLYAMQWASLARFDDTAGAWTHVPGAFDRLYQLAVHGGALYLNAKAGLFLSRDHGETWVDARAALPAAGEITNLAQYGGDLFCSASGRAYRLDARVGRWAPLPTPALVDFAYVVAAEGATVVLSGTTQLTADTRRAVLYISRDRGRTWEEAGDVSPGVRMRNAAISGGVMFAGPLSGLPSVGGVVRSEDDGFTWIPTDDGLPTEHLRVSSFARTLRVLWLGTRSDGIFRSDDEGATWATTTRPRSYNSITDIVVGASGVLACDKSEDGLIVSRDGGRTWTAEHESLGRIRRIARFGDATYALGDGVWVLADGQGSWRKASSIPAVDIAIAGDVGVLATWSKPAFSRNGGKSWEYAGLDFPAVAVTSVRDVFYAGGSTAPWTGIVRSSSGGADWAFAGSGSIGPWVRSLVAHGSTLYAGMTGGLSRSEDGGESWEPLTDDLPLSAPDRLLVHRDTLYAYNTVTGPKSERRVYRTWVGPPTYSPQLTVVAPEIGAPVEAGADVLVRVQTHDHVGGWRWSVDAPLGSESEPNADVGGAIGGPGLEATITGLDPGRDHALFVALVDDQGRALSPRITRRVEFSVSEAGAPILANTLIAYTSSEGDAGTLYVVRPDGSGVKVLAGRGEGGAEPTWSHDGRLLAFISPRTGPRDVYIMNPDGSNVRRLTHGQSARHLRWAPDGSRLAYLNVRSGEVGLLNIVDVEDLTVRRLPNTEETAAFAWSPDGSHFACVTGQGLHRRAYIMDVNGGNTLNLHRIEGRPGGRGISWYSAPVWIPDASAVMFARLDKESSGFAADITTTRVSPDGIVREDGVLPRMPLDLAPDGVHMSSLFDFSPDYTPHTTISRLGGGEVMTLPWSGLRRLAWAPDSSAFVVKGSNGPVVIRLDGGTSVGLPSNGEQHAWQPFPKPPAQPFPILTVESPEQDAVYPADTEKVDIAIRMENTSGAWQWRLNSPFPHEGPGKGVQAPSGTTARVEGLDPGRQHRVYLAPVTTDGTLLQPAFHHSVSFRVAAPEPSPSLVDTHIAYVSGADGEVYLIPYPGGPDRRLTHDGLAKSGMSWSPDGRRITYAAGKDDDSNIWTMRADGTDRNLLTDRPGYDGSPAWSPDGASIAYVSTRDGKSEAYLMRTDGSGSAPVTDTAHGVASVSWAPEGDRLAVGVEGEWYKSERIAVVHLATGTMEVYDSAFSASEPVWNPSGSQIAFHRNVGDPGRGIFLIDPDWQAERGLLEHGMSWLPTWAPDASMIAYVSSSGQLMVRRADGSDARVMDESVSYPRSLAWSPFPHNAVEAGDLPAVTRLLPNYPNPFSQETVIPYELRDAADVVITVYAVGGERVRAIRVGAREPGRYAARWDGRNEHREDVSSGMYFCELRAGERRFVRRMAVRRSP